MSETIEIVYAVCSDCDWYVLCGEDETEAESQAHWHRDGFGHAVHTRAKEVSLDV